MSASPSRLPRWIDLGLIPALSLASALLVGGIIVALLGESPWLALRLVVAGAVGTQEGLGYTLFYATNFIFTGLAVAVAYHAGLFNIGAEGQAYIGGLGVGLVALAGGSWPAWGVLPLTIVGGAVFGAFMNAGQFCCSTERVYVVESIYDEFVRRVLEKVKTLRQGASGEFDVGPMIWPQQLELVELHRCADDCRLEGHQIGRAHV